MKSTEILTLISFSISIFAIVLLNLPENMNNLLMVTATILGVGLFESKEDNLKGGKRR